MNTTNVNTVVVATVQQQMQIATSHEEYREMLRRFLKIATGKRARLVIFPELGGMVVMPPLLGDFRSGLIKRAEQGRRKGAGLWDRLAGWVAGRAGEWFKADLRPAMGGLLDVAAQSVWEQYRRTFSELAGEFRVTIVAPSGYFPDPEDGVIRNLSAVFGEDGELLGTQAKVKLTAEDREFAQEGQTWQVIPTAVGRLGVVLGGDVLYPEVGRILAYQSADLLVVQGACFDTLLYNKIRTGALARMQDNQLFAAVSFLVGTNRISRGERLRFAGKSALFAPQELTPRKTGVLVEMTSQYSEGVLTAPWDFDALRNLWDTSDTPVRRDLPLEQLGTVLAQLYGRLEQLPQLPVGNLLPEAKSEPPSLATPTAYTGEDIVGEEDMTDSASVKAQAYPVSEEAIAVVSDGKALGLDDLEVLSSITSRWPLDDSPIAQEVVDYAPEGPPKNGGSEQASDMGETSAVSAPRGSGENAARPESGGEDETDEMDALPRRSK